MIDIVQVVVVAVGVFLSTVAGGCWLELRSIRRAIEPRRAFGRIVPGRQMEER